MNSKDFVRKVMESLARGGPDCSSDDDKRLGGDVRRLLDKNTDSLRADLADDETMSDRALDVAKYNGLPLLFSASLVLILGYFFEIPEDVATAIVVCGGFVGNFIIHVILKK